MDTVWNPGTLTTAGNLVFQGRSDGDFFAYDARNGKELWRTRLGLGIAAPPITYSIGGRQYVALLVGWGSAAPSTAESAELGWAYKAQMRRLVAFSLDGKTALPAQPPPHVPVPVDAPFFEVDAANAATGKDIYGQCAFCHGPNAVSGGLAPDLRASPVVLTKESFADVLTSGSRRPLGMPSYQNLSDGELEALRHYIRQQAEAKPGDTATGAGAHP